MNHSMLRLTGFVFALGGFASPAAAQKTAPLKVCLVSGSLEYNSDASLAKLQKHLEKNFDVVCSRAFIKDKNESDLPGLEHLKSCDVMLLFTRRLKITGDQLDQVKKYCRAGKPIVGLRTASHAFQNWLELDQEILGGNYKGHYKEGPMTAVEVAPQAKDHPILAGVMPFKSQGSLYKNTGLAKDVDILLRGAIPGHDEPIAWTRIHNEGRIFYTSLGHQRDFDDPSFIRLVVNSLFWTANQTPRPRP